MTTTTAPAWKVFGARGIKPRGNNFDTLCPSHNDDKKSLSLSIADDGKILLRCFAGCPAVTIVESLGMTMQDLYPPDDKPFEREPSRIVKCYDYFDEHGVLLYQNCRKEPKGFTLRSPSNDSSHDGWTYKVDGVRRVLYRLPELIASLDRPCILVEGEKDADSLAALGFNATACIGGAQGWRPEYAAQGGMKRQWIILPDNDAPGIQFAVSASLDLDGALIVRLPVSPKGDVSDWIAAGGTAKDLRTLIVEAARQRLAQAQRMVDRLTGVK